jgi:UDP-N-acetylmuramate--alanine ligase
VLEGVLELAVPGHHNLQNALAAIGIGLELGVPFDRISAALAEFQGVERRYQHRGTARGVRVVDDYGHHPTEIAAVLRAARDGRPSRIIAVFQPHRYRHARPAPVLRSPPPTWSCSLTSTRRAKRRFRASR